MTDSPRVDEIYRASVKALGSRFAPEMEHAVRRYARTVALAERCWDAVPKRSILGRTDRGGQQIHPAIQAALRAEQVAAEFGKALGLEPTGKRPAAGRPAGAVSAPDRAALPPKLRAVE